MGAQACKLKIILDSENLTGLSTALCTATRYLTQDEVNRLTPDVAYPIIKKLNEAENLMVDVQKLLVDNVIDYDGPLPNFLK